MCEWLGIAFAIYISEAFWHPLVYLIAIAFIGARQHALLVIGHDASHYTLLKKRSLNDWLSDIFVHWPTFSSVQAFRFFHGAHHRFLNTEKDKNRILWKTHNADGELHKDWQYPKNLSALPFKILRKGIGLTGIRWVLRGILAMTALVMYPPLCRMDSLMLH